MRNIDSLRHSKSTKVQTSYKLSRSRIRLTLPNTTSKLNRILPYILITISVGLVVFTTTQTKIYQGIILLQSLKNQSLLIGFQNSAELRPTGGFWGSFAVLDTGHSIGDSTLSFDTNPYKMDNRFKDSSDIDLPEPMKQQWPDASQSFVNANWLANFPDTAKTIQWYFGQGWGNKNTSGVIAVSSLSLIDLLKLTGPIEINDITIDSQNFTRIMSEQIDNNYWKSEANIKENEPKTLIKELYPKVLAKAREIPAIKLIDFTLEQLSKGRILMYFNEQKLEKSAISLGVSGQLTPYTSDYLYVNNANISGHKTSLNIEQRIDYKTVDNNDKAKSILTITRKHNDLWPHHNNANFTRIYTPLGSTLQYIKLGGDDITDSVLVTQESGRTVFGFWFSTDPGQIKMANIQYRLPFDKIDSTYQLVYQKQPGTNPDYFNMSINDSVIYTGTLEKGGVIINAPWDWNFN